MAIELYIDDVFIEDFSATRKALEKAIQEIIDRQAEKLLQVAKDMIPQRVGNLKPADKCFVFR